MRFLPLFSGSSGNSAYAGTSSGGILIDAGVNCKQLSAALLEIGVDPSEIKAIFITHEHTDHISALKVFAKKYNCTVFASAGTIAVFGKSGCAENSDCRVIEHTEKVCGLEITPFRTSHDARESLGYTVSDGECKISVISDTGVITGEITDAVAGSDLVMIESNHDTAMLRTGPYPYQLKVRIMGKYGHLSNEDCAKTVAELYESGTRRFILSHLSRENNDPVIAYNTTSKVLSQMGLTEGIDYTLEIAGPRNTLKKYITL